MPICGKHLLFTQPLANLSRRFLSCMLFSNSGYKSKKQRPVVICFNRQKLKHEVTAIFFFFRCAFQHSLRATEKKIAVFFSAFMVRFSLEDHLFRLISTLQARFNQELHCLILFCRALMDWFSLSWVIWQVTGINSLPIWSLHAPWYSHQP